MVSKRDMLGALIVTEDGHADSDVEVTIVVGTGSVDADWVLEATGSVASSWRDGWTSGACVALAPQLTARRAIRQIKTDWSLRILFILPERVATAGTFFHKRRFH